MAFVYRRRRWDLVDVNKISIFGLPHFKRSIRLHVRYATHNLICDDLETSICLLIASTCSSMLVETAGEKKKINLELPATARFNDSLPRIIFVTSYRHVAI